MLAISAAVHGAIGILGGIVWLYMWAWLKRVTAADSTSVACSKIAFRGQRQMAGLIGLANMVISAVLIAMILKLGTTHREGDNNKINWSYFAIGEAVAFGLLGVGAGLYYWFESTLNMLLLCGAWAMWCVLLGLGALPEHFNQRLFLFIGALVLQVGSVVFTWFASGTWTGMLTTGKGIASLLVLGACLIVYDAIWFVSYLNRSQPGARLHTRWLPQIAFFIASAVSHVAVPAFWAWFYEPKKADVDYERSMAAAAPIPAAPERAELLSDTGL